MPRRPPVISAARWRAYRTATFRTSPRLRLRNPDDAVRFVQERGFVYFWPIKAVDMPSLWAAVAGDRPVADAHDDPGHVTWGWKDNLLGARRWYYAKLLRGKGTMVALPALKYFYALSENYGDPDDYLQEYQAGRLSQEAKQIHEVLTAQGALDTVSLRRQARLSGKDGNTRFGRALAELQRGLRILPIGVAKAGAWHYAFIYELVHRWHPELLEAARPIGRREARVHLAHFYLRSVGAAAPSKLASLFGWSTADGSQVVDDLLATGQARCVTRVAGQAVDWIATEDL